LAILGRDHLGGNLYTMTFLDKNQAGQAMRSGRKAWHIDTSVFKDRVSRLIHSETGHWSLPAELPPGYIEQMCSEEKVDDRPQQADTAGEGGMGAGERRRAQPLLGLRGLRRRGSRHGAPRLAPAGRPADRLRAAGRRRRTSADAQTQRA